MQLAESRRGCTPAQQSMCSGNPPAFTSRFCCRAAHFLRPAINSFSWYKNSIFDGFPGITPVAGSILRPLSQTHISKREFKNGHISRFCYVFQVIQVISSGKFFIAEEVDLSFNSETKEHPQISNPSFWKRDLKTFFYTCSNSGRNASTPQIQSDVSWISSQAELEMSFIKTRLEMWVQESGRKIDPATGVTQKIIKIPAKRLGFPQICLSTRPYEPCKNIEVLAPRDAPSKMVQLWCKTSTIVVELKWICQLWSVIKPVPYDFIAEDQILENKIPGKGV